MSPAIEVFEDTEYTVWPKNLSQVLCRDLPVHKHTSPLKWEINIKLIMHNLPHRYPCKKL